MKGRFSEIEGIFYKDVYVIKSYKEEDFDYIIDIGGNTGTFTLMSHMHFPNAKIFSYEPCVPSYRVMCENLKGFCNLTIINKALGDGRCLYLKVFGKETSTGNQFIEENNGQHKTKSVTLLDIISNNNIDLSKNILLKIDCEGGEKYLLSNEYNDILRRCKHIAMEVHFKCSRNKEFDWLPEWLDYKNWIYDVFDKTYNILYHKSNKHKGYGIYALTKKV